MFGNYGKSGKETSFAARGLSKEGANKYIFNFMDKESGKEKKMSVAAYFTNILGIKLQFPALQCVTVRFLCFQAWSSFFYLLLGKWTTKPPHFQA